MTGFADFLVRNGQPRLRAADGLPEIDVERIFQVRATLRRRRFFALRVAAEELGEQIAESATSIRLGLPPGASLPRPLTGLGKIIGEVEAGKSHSRPLILRTRPGGESAVGIETLLIVHLALLRVA